MITNRNERNFDIFGLIMNCCCRSERNNRRDVSWSRLLESRNGSNKIHPVDETDDETEHFNDPPSSTEPISRSQSMHLTGSSLELAPSLMTIYDNLVEAETDTVDVDTSVGVVTSPATVGRHQHLYDNNNRDVSAENVTQSISGVPVSVTLAEMEQQDSMTSSVTSASPPTLLSDERDDGDPAELVSGASDAKKRPLSVSSTSSSSTSSLPRHQRKKIAGMTSPMANNHSTPLGLLGPVAMDCSDNHDNDAVVPGNRSVVEMDVASDDDDEQVTPTTRGSECSPDVKTRDDDNSANNNVTSSSLDTTQLPCQQKLDETSDQIESERHEPDSGHSYIDKVVAEILETEKTYVRDLREIIQGYQEPLQSTPPPDIEPEYINSLFGNVSDIYAFNSVFLEDLENCDMDPVKVAQCFVKRNEGFVIYTDYCTNYPRAVEILTECMRESVTCEIFKQKQLELRHSLPLGAYLLKPVQRILKYHLLLQNILNNFDKDHDGFSTVTQALGSMTNMAQHINEMKRKHEHAVRIQEIQSQLSDWDGADLTTYGDLVLEDNFRMYGAKSDRLFLLFEKCLLVAKKTEEGILSCKHSIECSNLMLVESIPKEPLSFHVIPWDNPKMQVTVRAKSLEQKRRWCQDIKRLILENYNAVIPDKAKELVMMLGKSKEEDDLDGSSLEPTPTRKQHTAPEYLEKRRVRRKSATILPDFGLLKGKKGGRRSEGSPASRHLPPQRRRSEAFISGSKVNLQSPTKQPTKNKCEASPKTSGSRFGSFFSRSRSRSLESIDLVQSKLDLPTNKKRVPKDAEEEDENGEEMYYSRPPSQCSDAGDQTLCDETIDEQDSFSEDVANVKDKPPLRKSDSFRIATKLHRIDSKRVVDAAVRNRFKVRKDERRRNRNSLDSSDCAPRREPASLVDDGYVSVRFSGFNLDPVESAISPTRRSAFSDSEENLGDYIELRSTAAATAASNRNVSIEKVASNNSVQNAGTDTSQLTSSPRVAKFSHWFNKHNGATTKTPPAVKELNCHKLLQKSNSFTAQNTRHQELLQEARMVRSRIGSDPLRSRAAGESVYDNYAAAIYGPLLGHSRSIDGQSASVNSSPRRSTPNVYLRSSARPFTSHFTNHSRDSPARDSPGRDDPWIPQNETNTPGNLNSATKGSVLRRSNSLSSVFDSMEDMRFRKLRGYKKKSDNLVFSNRSAFIATSVPRTIRHDIETERTIARLGTPPRDMGPRDFAAEVTTCKERGRIIARYATPPRGVMEPPKPHQSEAEYMSRMYRSYPDYGTDQAMSAEMSAASSLDYATPASVMSQSFSTSSPCGTGRDMWRDLEEYIKTSPETPALPKFPVYTPTRGETQRKSASLPRSETAMSMRSSHSSASSTMQSSGPTSPSSPQFSPSDGIVDSLKNAVFSITSRFTGRGTRSVGSSPVRSRSASALEDLRVRPPTPPPLPVSEQAQPTNTEARKDKRNRFVYNLARQYSMRIKNNRPRNFSDRKVEKDTATLARQIATLLKENRQGGNVIGARMAAPSKPVVLGTYTLQRHRPKKLIRDKNDDDDDEELDEELCNINSDHNNEDEDLNEKVALKLRGADVKAVNHDSGCPDVTMKSAHSDHDQIVPQQRVFNIEGATIDASLDHSPTPSPILSDAALTVDSSDENSSLYFYERRFLDDLESNFGEEDDVFRDSAVYSDDGAVAMDTESVALKMSIRDTVRLIEQRYKSKPVQKIEVKKMEKGHSIKEIMKCLETNTSYVKESHDSELMSDSITEKTSPTRHRELAECATLTRIRQNSFRVGEDSKEAKSAAGEDACVLEREPSPTKKGWVREVVDLLEHEPLS